MQITPNRGTIHPETPIRYMLYTAIFESALIAYDNSGGVGSPFIRE